MGKKELFHRTEVSPKEAAARLTELADGLIEGTVCLSKGGDYVVLHPGYRVSLEIGGAAKKDKAKLSVELSWRLDEEAPPREEELTIASRAPEPVDGEAGAEETEPGREAEKED